MLRKMIRIITWYSTENVYFVKNPVGLVEPVGQAVIVRLAVLEEGYWLIKEIQHLPKTLTLSETDRDNGTWGRNWDWQS